MNNLYNNSPYIFKAMAVTFYALWSNRKKYGEYFNKHFSYLMSASGAQQEKDAKKELSDFLLQMRHQNGYYDISADPDIYKMPVISKRDVIKNYHSLLSGKPFAVVKSSGTTGQPLAIPYSKSAYQKEYAFWWYHRSYEGIKRGDRIATFAGHKVIPIWQKSAPYWVMNYAENQMLFSSYHFKKSNIASYVSALNSFKPLLIHGYPSSIYLIARYILENSIRLQFRPRMIITASETTLDFQKSAIEQAFGCKNYIWYGNTEYCGHITECPEGKLHIQPYHSFVRILNEDGIDVFPGEEGRIVATNFTNTVFPLINYDTGDVVRLSREQDCSCGRGGAIVDYIFGRMEDYIITPEGRYIGRLDHLFKDAKHVRNAQLEQNRLDELIVRIEKDDHYSTAIEEIILKEARNRLGGEMMIHFEYVTEIPKNKNGKFKFVVQNLDFSKLNDIERV